MGTITLRATRDNLNQQIRRCLYIIGSAEAKLNRVDPLSDEFEETLSLIEENRKELEVLGLEELRIRREIADHERIIQ